MTGSEIRARRKDLGLTLREAARRCGISASLLSDIEHGNRRVTTRVLIPLAQSLQVKPWAVAGVTPQDIARVAAALERIGAELATARQMLAALQHREEP